MLQPSGRSLVSRTLSTSRSSSFEYRLRLPSFPRWSRHCDPAGNSKKTAGHDAKLLRHGGSSSDLYANLVCLLLGTMARPRHRADKVAIPSSCSIRIRIDRDMDMDMDINNINVNINITSTSAGHYTLVVHRTMSSHWTAPLGGDHVWAALRGTTRFQRLPTSHISLIRPDTVPLWLCCIRVCLDSNG